MWIETDKQTAGEKARKRYESIATNRLSGIGAIRVRDLKPMHLQAILNEMAEEGYARKTITEVKQAAAAALDFAMRQPQHPQIKIPENRYTLSDLGEVRVSIRRSR